MYASSIHLICANIDNEYRSSRSQMFFKVAILKNSAIFTEKYLYWSLFSINLQARPEGLQRYKKETPIQLFFCEYCKVFKNSFFYITSPAAASLSTFVIATIFKRTSFLNFVQFYFQLLVYPFLLVYIVNF